jgi:integral membrane protein (TIGR00529 family)
VNPSIALLISIACILVLLRLKVHPGAAVFAGSIALSLMVLAPIETPRLMVSTITSLQTIRLISIVIFALTLSKLMELRGLLLRLAHTLESIGPKAAMHIVPSVIGMVPMPGGALVSATAIKDLARRLDLTSAQATYINYWFRHVWEFAAPVYPSVIAASVVLSVPLSTIVITMLPIIPLMAVPGGIVSYRILKDKTSTSTSSLSGREIVDDLLRAAWPVILLVAMVLAGLEAAFAFLITGVVLALQQGATKPEVLQSLRYALGPKVLFLLYSVMLYKAVVEQSGASYALFADMQSVGMPLALILVFLPMLVGFATGLSMAFVGISFTLLLPFMMVDGSLEGSALFFAYIGGAIGYMVSPLHLCLILSAEFFETRLGDVYRLMAPPLVAVFLLGLLAYAVI